MVQKNNNIDFLERRIDLGNGASVDSTLQVPYVALSDVPESLREPLRELLNMGKTYHCGHVTIRDDNFGAFIPTDRDTPAAPVFVRDLAGRVIHIGIGALVRRFTEWHRYLHAKDGEERTVDLLENIASIVFPDGCRWVDSGIYDWSGQLEGFFLTKFRTLDMSFDYMTMNSGYGDSSEEPHVAGQYPWPHVYPYKMRLDTFYQDGWRLPQAKMLYAVPIDGDEEGLIAAELGQGIRSVWEGRPQGEDYSRFVQRMGGSAWHDDLFKKGCTLIPTFEACNGAIVVGRDFSIEDYWPGRAVTGLHTVVDIRPNHSPAGTILEVRAPGYVTAYEIIPAEVVVSDGSGYVSPNEKDPLPYIPNLDLPHPRTVAAWGMTWIATHPEHFEEPALWGWDVITGRFMQLSGPLWDPVHYHYACTKLVTDAFEKHVPDINWLVPVPAEMHGRFYPVVPMHGFDTLSYKEHKRRMGARIWPVTGARRVLEEKVFAGVGYHPLPQEFEYEIEPYWMPDLHPTSRNFELCPEELIDRLCPVVIPNVSTEEWISHVDGPQEAVWFAAPERLGEIGQNPLEIFPQLARFIIPDLPVEEQLVIAPPPYLAMPSIEMETILVVEGVEPELEFEPSILTQLGAKIPRLVSVLEEDRAVGIEVWRTRHLIFREDKAFYTMAWWEGVSSSELAVAYAQVKLDQSSDRVKGEAEIAEEKAHLAPGEVPSTNVPEWMQ